MKFVLLLIFTISLSWGACDSPISRTNFVANTVLTSSELNTQFNTVYAAANTVDGSCITDGTVTSNKLDTTTLGVLINTAQLGCKTEFSNVSTLSIDKCYLATNGVLTTTTAATTVTWGTNSGSSEAASTRYYVYALSTSTTTALALSIRTTVPDDNGYNGNNRVISTFYNNASSDIDQYSIDQWHVNDFIPSNTEWSTSSNIVINATTTAPTKGTVVNDNLYWRRVGGSMQIRIEYKQTAGGSAGSGVYLFQIPTGFLIDATKTDIITSVVNLDAATNSVGVFSSSTSGAAVGGYAKIYNTTNVVLFAEATGFLSSTIFDLSNTESFSGMYTLPIKGWLE